MGEFGVTIRIRDGKILKPIEKKSIMSNIVVTKSHVECYKLRSDKGAWADITIDMKDKTGRIQIASDYGSWQYYWGACGETFKKFLIGLDLHYIAGKFGESRWFDLEKTIASLRSRINDMDKHEVLLEELSKLEDCSSREEFNHIIWSDCENILEMEDNNPDVCESVSPMFMQFWNKLWPSFLEALKSELQDAQAV